jgi:alkylation response protein AidB-like acyl-CoA dehydrogenase
MDFQPTEERRILADMIGKFIQNDYPLKERLTAGSSALGYCPAAYSTMAQLGLIGALFEEEVGGFGGSGFDIATVFTELGKGLVVEPLNDTALTTGYILAQTDQLDLVEQIVLGKKRVALGLIENGADYDWSAPETLARKTDAEWQLNGVKTSVKFAHGADALVVSAQTQSAPRISLFLIEAAATGLAEHPFQTVDGGNACEITLHNTPAQLLGVEGEAYPLIDAAAARAYFGPLRGGLGVDGAH